MFDPAFDGALGSPFASRLFGLCSPWCSAAAASLRQSLQAPRQAKLEQPRGSLVPGDSNNPRANAYELRSSMFLVNPMDRDPTIGARSCMMPTRSPWSSLDVSPLSLVLTVAHVLQPKACFCMEALGSPLRHPAGCEIRMTRGIPVFQDARDHKRNLLNAGLRERRRSLRAGSAHEQTATGCTHRCPQASSSMSLSF